MTTGCPLEPATPAPADWYSPDELDIFRLSSKSTWDLPIELSRGKRVHFLVSHPTAPIFDGPEDRNGTRNHDQIRFLGRLLACLPRLPLESLHCDAASGAGGLEPCHGYVGVSFAQPSDSHEPSESEPSTAPGTRAVPAAARVAGKRAR